MKKIILSVIIIVLGYSVQAQNIKLGHINSTQLLSLMPETKVADSTLQKFGAQLENQIKTMSAEYESKINDYKKDEANMAEPIKQLRVKEITDLEDRIQDFQQSAQQSVQKKKEELYSPIIKKADEAIKSVAKENGFTYIFDSSVGALLFANDSDDILAKVKSKLGLK
ncbi:MAG: OmpH family outer membrane protein [Bacteroidia bacterium]|nr:OmpH family outer membrane protein [Bacteroidia bacterium]MCZ2277980.1 OmpH family outer membrane protein [Bacteroidia bacterium]